MPDKIKWNITDNTYRIPSILEVFNRYWEIYKRRRGVKKNLFEELYKRNFMGNFHSFYCIFELININERISRNILYGG